MQLEHIILSALIHDETFTRKVLPFLKDEYFSSAADKNVFLIISKHFNTYNCSPTTEAIAIDAVNLEGLTAPLAKEIESTINKLVEVDYNLDWLIDSSEKFCKERAVYLAIVEAIEIQDGNTKKTVSAIPDILSKALSVSFDSNVGLDYILSAEQRYDDFNKTELDKIPFGLHYLDKITKNGFGKKTLNLIVAAASTGKEQPISEPVLTPNGWSTMGQLRPGDYVIGSAGLPIEVLSIHPQGIKDVYTVETQDGVKIRCGKDHLWSVYSSSRINGKNGQKLFTKTTQELIDGGVRKLDTTPRFTLPEFGGVQYGISIGYAYALGYCLGNGCFSSSQLLVSYHTKDTSQILSLLCKSLGTPTRNSIVGEFGGQSAYSWGKLDPEIAKYRNSGLSHEKSLHQDHKNWLSWDYDSRLELLKGLLDSDGCISTYKTKNSFSSTSTNLLILVRDLIRSLGGRSGEIHQTSLSDNCKFDYFGALYFRMPLCPFELKQERWKKSCYNMRSSISSITKEVYQEEQVCITVDAPDHLYVTTGFKLTHNSILLCHHAAHSLSIGKNVLFITLEMSANAISERIDANLLDVNIDDLYTNGKEHYMSRFKKLQAKTYGKLYIKEYPISTAHVGNFTALLDELKAKKQFVPDIIVIDYLNICASATNSTNSNSYERVKQIGEQLRSLAQINDVPILSAIQLNRSGVGNNDPDMSNLADSYALGMVADFIMALVSNEALASLEQILCVQIKNRYSNISVNNKFVLGLDKSRMKFYDVEDNYTDEKNITNESTVTLVTKKRPQLSSFLTD
jgi:replicative DNA helicase